MRKFINMYKAQRGFTLIELLVVIAIIGILASIILVSLSGARSKGRDAQRVANLEQAAKAIISGLGTDANADSSTAFAGCAGITRANHSTTACTGNAAQLTSIIDPNGSGQTVCAGATGATNTSGAASAASCQFGVFQAGGGVAPTFSDWEVVTYLETGSGPYTAGLACVRSNANGIQTAASCL